MPEKKSRLGAIAPTINTDTVLFTATRETVISSLSICYHGSANDTQVFVSHSIGSGVEDEDYIFNNLSIYKSDTFIATIGICMSIGDSLIVRSTQPNTSFILWGSEV